MTRTVTNSPLGPVHSFNVRLELNCAARTARPLQFTGFDAAGVRNYERGADEQPRDPTPGSAFAALLGEFCPSPAAAAGGLGGREG